MTNVHYTSASTQSVDDLTLHAGRAVAWVRRATDSDSVRREAQVEASEQQAVLAAAGFDESQIVTIILLGVSGWRAYPAYRALVAGITDGRIVALATGGAHRLSRNPRLLRRFLDAVSKAGTCRLLIAGEEFPLQWFRAAVEVARLPGV